MRRLLPAALCALGSVCMAHTPQEPCRTPGEARAIVAAWTLVSFLVAVKRFRWA